MSRTTLRPLVAAAALAVAVPLVGAGPAAATPSFTVTRPDSTTDRYTTAAYLAWGEFRGGARGSVTTAVVVNGEDPVDGLAAAALAGPDRPILYSRRDGLPDGTRWILDELGVGRVLVVGGERSVPDVGTPGSVVESDRVAGADRYGTAAEVARHVAAERGTAPTTAVLARGDAYADALAASAHAAEAGVPVLLTAPGGLPAATRDALRDLRIRDVVVVGGPGAVAPAVVSQVEALGVTVRRIAGTDRYATAAAIATDPEFAPDGGTPDSVVLVNGTTLVDALPASVAAARRASPVLLARRDDLPPATGEYLQAHRGTLEHALVVGGTNAVSEGVLRQVRIAAGVPVPAAPTIRSVTVQHTAGEDLATLEISVDAAEPGRRTVYLVPADDTDGYSPPATAGDGTPLLPASGAWGDVTPDGYRGGYTSRRFVPVGSRWEIWASVTVNSVEGPLVYWNSSATVPGAQEVVAPVPQGPSVSLP